MKEETKDWWIDGTTPLWWDYNGRIVCVKHGGNYLSCAVEANPTATTHSTPLTTWELLTDDDRSYFDREVGVAASCETCGAY
jgi:hypothetical protein